KCRMPTLVLHENLVHFAAFANHVGYSDIKAPRVPFRAISCAPEIFRAMEGCPCVNVLQIPTWM
ncbi:MAG TPA: hypothetical protein VFT30_04495, partial [Nitrospira sp.]|nr:hypothetical protein [Nitrospira sp.]